METRVPGAKARNRTGWWNSRSICGKWISLFIRGRNLWIGGGINRGRHFQAQLSAA